MSSSSESDDEDYDAYVDSSQQDADNKRFPIHDCCEFDDIDALKVRTSGHGGAEGAVRTESFQCRDSLRAVSFVEMLDVLFELTFALPSACLCLHNRNSCFFR